MSWRKKKKEMRKIKHKAILIICLMFAVVIGLIILLTLRIIKNNTGYYKIDSRVEELNKEKPIENSGYKAVGWLKIQGTDIDLPIVHSEDQYEEFPVQLESFVWSRTDVKKDNTYFDIVGHNIFNLSAKPKIKSDMFNRFEQLMAFAYYDFAKNNQYVQLTIDDEDYIYKIFAVSFIDKSLATFFPTRGNPDESMIKNLIEIYENESLYKYDVDVNENDKIISLSTCTRFYGADSNKDFYVVGRLLREDENINHYKVAKNNNYKKVEKILKGDENNE